MSNPWRVDDSDDEDDVDHRLYRHVSFSQQQQQQPPMPSMLARQSVPKIADWDPVVVVEDIQKKTFGRRKTAPSFENAPSDHKPIFYGGGTLKSSNSILERNKPNRLVVAHTPDTPPASPPAVRSHFDPILCLEENLHNFIYTHIPKDYPIFIHCSLRRDKTGIQQGFFPTFYLNLERPADGKKIFLLAARKVAKVNRQREYFISTNVETLSEKSGGDGCVGRLRESNLAGTEYTLYDNGRSPNKSRNKQSNNNPDLRRELAGIAYNTNILGLKGPRQLNVLIPELDHDVQPSKNEDTILGRWRDKKLHDLLQLRNQLSKFDETTRLNILQFQDNRVVRPSIKNFLIALENENHSEEVVMQFGRVDDDTFVCDYRYPLSAIQAFGIALSSFDRRFARE